jgi:hypothetical protein
MYIDGYMMNKLVVWLRPEDKKTILEKKAICCNGMSDSELGRRSIFQYLDIRMTLKVLLYGFRYGYGSTSKREDV